MPYIHSNCRPSLDNLINQLLAHAPTEADLNYFISKTLWTRFDMFTSYSTAQSTLGMLESVKQEFYRRKVAPYEDLKMQENGDL